jgi:hypothetical protein
MGTLYSLSEKKLFLFFVALMGIPVRRRRGTPVTRMPASGGSAEGGKTSGKRRFIK